MVTRARAARILALWVVATTLLAACLSDDDDGVEAVITVEPGEAIVVPTASPTPTVAPTPTSAEWIDALLEPGQPAAAPDSIFFLYGPDVWIIDDDLSLRQVTRERRARAVATAPDGERAAVLIMTAAAGREAEEVRIVGVNGEESVPIYGPEVVSDPGGNPRVRQLAWSPDGEQLAVVRDDGSVWLAGPERDPEELLPGEGLTIDRLVWAPSGNGLAMLTRRPDGTGIIQVVALEEGDQVTIEPQSSFGDVGWIPGDALIVATEDRAGGLTPAAGSLFTILPDGTDRQLLLSAGEFGPTVGISHLTPSPDGTMIAFVVNAPNLEGLLEFQALWVLELETGARRQFPVAAGQGVNELWWIGDTLAWRATAAQPNDIYDGAEPFVIEVADFENSTSRLIYTAD